MEKLINHIIATYRMKFVTELFGVSENTVRQHKSFMSSGGKKGTKLSTKRYGSILRKYKAYLLEQDKLLRKLNKKPISKESKKMLQNIHIKAMKHDEVVIVLDNSEHLESVQNGDSEQAEVSYDSRSLKFRVWFNGTFVHICKTKSSLLHKLEQLAKDYHLKLIDAFRLDIYEYELFHEVLGADGEFDRKTIKKDTDLQSILSFAKQYAKTNKISLASLYVQESDKDDDWAESSNMVNVDELVITKPYALNLSDFY